MVLRLLTFCTVLSFVTLGFSQNSLFYTDSYGTNLYRSSSNHIYFSNNAFALLDTQRKSELIHIFNDFFTEIELQVSLVPNNSLTMFQFSYEGNHTEKLLSWSGIWFQKYEGNLSKFLSSNIENTYLDKKDSYQSIEELVLNKYKLNDYLKSKNINTDYYSTNIHISSNQVLTEQFLKDNLSPILSIRRVVTNSSANQFKESFKVVDLFNRTCLMAGPNSKSRLVDCLSMHILSELQSDLKILYLSQFSVFTFDSSVINLENLLIDQSVVKRAVQSLKELMNDPTKTFYNIDDLENLDNIASDYSIDNLLQFRDIFITNRVSNELYPLTDSAPTYQLRNLSDTLYFKVNSTDLFSEKDSLLLESISLFLQNNSSLKTIILANASKNEYTRIERSKYLDLIEKYKEYTPVKYSRKMDLSLYRSLIVFDVLVQQGVQADAMICMSKLLSVDANKGNKLVFKIKQE